MAFYATTRWSLVARAGREGVHRRRALEELCQIYRPAVLRWFRHHGVDSDGAHDLTQSFFVKLLEGKALEVADPGRGRFRTFLSTALRNFHLHQIEREQAGKRGGGAIHLPYDDTISEPRSLTPEEAFDRDFARVVLTRAIERLAAEAQESGRAELFRELRPYLVEQPEGEDYERLAAKLHMRRNTVAVAVHRLRGRLQELAREELMDTVYEESALEDELRVLRRSLARSARPLTSS